MPLRFTFKEAPVLVQNIEHADPEIIGRELMRISAANRRRLKPLDVVEIAKNRRNPLHRHFEWENDVAAEKYRLEQARELIRCVRISDDATDEPPRRAFLSIADEDGRAYRTISDVLGSRDLQLAVLVAAERELKSFELRYSELIDICALVRPAVDRLSDRIRTAKQERQSGGEARPQ